METLEIRIKSSDIEGELVVKLNSEESDIENIRKKVMSIIRKESDRIAQGKPSYEELIKTLNV
jgi:hypothetical protein